MSHGYLAAGPTGLSLFPWHCQNSKHTDLYSIMAMFLSELRLLMVLALALKESKVTGLSLAIGLERERFANFVGFKREISRAMFSL